VKRDRKQGDYRRDRRRKREEWKEVDDEKKEASSICSLI
jgi:hypothetical protein